MGKTIKKDRQLQNTPRMNLNQLTFNQNQTIGNDMNMIFDTFLTYTIHDYLFSQQFCNVGSSYKNHFEKSKIDFFSLNPYKTTTQWWHFCSTKAAAAAMH